MGETRINNLKTEYIRGTHIRCFGGKARVARQTVDTSTGGIVSVLVEGCRSWNCQKENLNH